MAKQSLQRVHAIDINTSQVVECDESEAVSIKVIPTVRNPYGGDGYPALPAMQAAFGMSRPIRLLSIEPAAFNRERPWPYARFETTPYKVSNGLGIVERTQGSCYVRNFTDINDPWLSDLTEADKSQLVQALGLYQQGRRHSNG